MFSVKITSEEFKNARKTSLPQTFLGLERVRRLRTSAWEANEKPVNLDMFLRWSCAGKSHNYCDAIVSKKLRFQTDFCPH